MSRAPGLLPTATPAAWAGASPERRWCGTRPESRVHGVPDCPESLHTLFRRVAEANVAIDMILKNIMREGAAKVSFTVAADEQAAAIQAANAAAQEIGAAGVVSDSEVSKVSVVGLGMKTHFGVAATMLEALARTEVGVQMITTSEIKISVLVERSLATWALRAVHRAFGLDGPIDGDPAPFIPGFRRRQPQPRSLSDDGWCPTITPASQSATAAGLEDLVISGVELDDRQGRVTVLNIPDRPGCAAQILRRVAEETIFVDMIVQNISLVGTPNLSITVLRRDVERAAAVIAEVVGPHRVATEPAIAKLSVVGVGMRSHTGVAATMFLRLPSGTSPSPWSIPARSRSTWSPVCSKGVQVWKACKTRSFNLVGRRRRRASEPWFIPPDLVSGPFRSHRDLALLFFRGSNHGIEGSIIRGMHRRAGDTAARRRGRSGRLATDG